MVDKDSHQAEQPKQKVQQQPQQQLSGPSPLWAVLSNIHRNQKSGILTVIDGPREHRLFFSEGLVGGATLSESDMPLGYLALKKGLVNSIEFMQAQHEIVLRDRKPGEVYQEIAKLTDAQLDELLEQQALDHMFWVCRLHLDGISFEEGTHAGAEMTPYEVNTNWLIWECLSETFTSNLRSQYVHRHGHSFIKEIQLKDADLKRIDHATLHWYRNIDFAANLYSSLNLAPHVDDAILLLRYLEVIGSIVLVPDLEAKHIELEETIQNPLGQYVSTQHDLPARGLRTAHEPDDSALSETREYILDRSPQTDAQDPGDITSIGGELVTHDHTSELGSFITDPSSLSNEAPPRRFRRSMSDGLDQYQDSFVSQTYAGSVTEFSRERIILSQNLGETAKEIHYDNAQSNSE